MIVADDDSYTTARDSTRGAIGEAIGKVLKYDVPITGLAEQLAELQAGLRGSGLADRLAYAFTQSPWNLMNDEEEMRSGRPTLIIDLGRQLAQADDDLVTAAAQRSRVGDEQTVKMLFEEVARARADDQLLRALEAQDPLPIAAILGVVLGLASVRGDLWADAVLAGWLNSAELDALVVPAVHFLPATDARAALAVAAVDRGAVAPLTLGRFLYGAWARSLSEASLVEILKRLQTASEVHAVEQALGILTQWLEDHPGDQRSPALTAVALKLLDQATSISDRASPMLGLYRSLAVRTLGLDYEAQLHVLLRTLRRLDTFLDTHDFELMDAVVAANPPRTVEAVVRELIDDDSGFRPWVMWAEDAKLLSRLMRTAGPDAVRAAVLELIPADRWRSIVRHFDFTSGPDEVVSELIERSSDDVFLARAAWEFMYPESGWTGSQADYLSARRKVAEQLHERADRQSRLWDWADRLLVELDEQIRTAEQEEAERGY